MQVYIAAQYHLKHEMAKHAARLRDEGIEVTSTWLEEPHGPAVQLKDLTDEQHTKYATQDLIDVGRADAMLFFSVSDQELTRRGGRHVEFGVALALGLPIVVVGPKENIFHYCYDVTHVTTVDEAVEILKARV